MQILSNALNVCNRLHQGSITSVISATINGHQTERPDGVNGISGNPSRISVESQLVQNPIIGAQWRFPQLITIYVGGSACIPSNENGILINYGSNVDGWFVGASNVKWGSEIVSEYEKTDEMVSKYKMRYVFSIPQGKFRWVY